MCRTSGRHLYQPTLMKLSDPDMHVFVPLKGLKRILKMAQVKGLEASVNRRFSESGSHVVRRLPLT